MRQEARLASVRESEKFRASYGESPERVVSVEIAVRSTTWVSYRNFDLPMSRTRARALVRLRPAVPVRADLQNPQECLPYASDRCLQARCPSSVEIPLELLFFSEHRWECVLHKTSATAHVCHPAQV